MKTLIIDPVARSRDELRRAFQASGEQVRSFESVSEGRRHLSDFRPDVVVLALGPDREDDWSFLADAGGDGTRACYVLVDQERLDDAVEAMTRGAADWLWRPVSEARVRLLLSRLCERRERERLAEQMRLRLARAEMAACLMGNSEGWKEALAAIEREASCGGSVLITGEAGTEKLDAARTLHLLSPRGAEPFVVASGAMPAVENGRRGTVIVPRIESWPLEAQDALVSQVEAPG